MHWPCSCNNRQLHEAEQCETGSCFSADASGGCPFTAFSPPAWSGTIDGSGAPAALSALWAALAAAGRPLALGLPGGPQLSFADPLSLQCFLRLQRGGLDVTRSRLPLRQSVVFANAGSGGVCDPNPAGAQNPYNFGRWMAQVRLAQHGMIKAVVPH